MKIVETIAEVKSIVRAWKKSDASIGFVPTMGYLHEGHLSLIQRARQENDRVVVSIFVNPTQFGANEDLDSYPRDLQHDAALCENAGVDLIFHPTLEQMYPKGFCSFVDVDVLTKELCGLSRPVHFRGVCTVVSKLFHIITPDRAYFGEKDAQQLAVIKRMVQDLNMDVDVIGCPIVRETDGLAKSSRNTYLSPEERKAALVLSRSITQGKKYVQQGEKNAHTLVQAMTEIIEKEPLAKIDYVKVVDLFTMQQIDTLDRPFLAAMAVYIEKTRLIDNFIVGGENV
ncbi:MAG: pantoate--beta-alanine ligase [Ruminococcus sp.]|nr:pantoate--beta-alanine ligase [Ruminococcus sp.]